MTPKENLKPLKTLVFSMGLILIGGTVMMVGLVWKKVASDGAPPKQMADCAGGKVDLKGRGEIVNTLISGREVRVTLQKNSGSSEIVTIDLCSGNAVGSLVIESDIGSTAE